MNRRKFLSSAFAVFASAWLQVDPATMRTLNAAVDAHCRVWLNGKEVTDSASVAYVPVNPGETGWGWTGQWLRNEHGCFYLDTSTGEAAQDTFFGWVRWEPTEGFGEAN